MEKGQEDTMSSNEGKRNNEHRLESGEPAEDEFQPMPAEFSSLTHEVVFILVCSIGQLYYSVLLGNIEVNQLVLVETLGISGSLLPWLVGSFLLANGISVSISGSLVDILPPKVLMVCAFVWMTVWNVIGVWSVSPSRWILFFVVRAMQGLALGMLVSGSISILGRLYKPGVRKTRVFSIMSSFSPIGFTVGGLQGGAFVHHLEWIFASTALVSGVFMIVAVLAIPSLEPARSSDSSKSPSIRDFDFLGAACSVTGNTLVIFGITQGSATRWQPYTYSLTIVGILILVAFYFVERYAKRPLIPHQLWSTQGFAPLMISFFMSYGSWLGAWQPNAVQFFLYIQHASPLRVALYFIPNAIAGIFVMWFVACTLHRFNNRWIFVVSMLANALPPALFLPQTPNTNYWALSMPGIALGTFGPDLAFAASTIFITSSVPKSYQGAAGSLLISVQNLSSAVLVSVAGAIGTSVSQRQEGAGAVTLDGLRAVWWFALGVTIAAGVLTSTMVKISKAEETSHVKEDA